MQWFWTNKKKQAAASAQGDTLFLPRQSNIYGSLEASVPCTIDGTVDGNISVQGALVINRNAEVKGTVSCDEVLVYGKVWHNIHCRGKATVFEGAHVEGKIFAPVIDIKENAFVKGEDIQEETTIRNNNDLFTDTAINAIVSPAKVVVNESTWF